MSKLLFNLIINNIFIISIFKAYKFSEIQGFPITIIIISMLLALLCFIFTIKEINIKNSLDKILLYVLGIYTLFNYLINDNSKITSLLLFLFFMIFYFISYREVNENHFEKLVNRFIDIMTILSLFGIYQFLGRNFGFPYYEPYFEGYMVTGYNWTTEIVLGGKFFWRSNSIFIEPSVFSQYLGLTIMLICDNLMKKIDIQNIIKFIIAILGFISSFSGTGILVMIVIISFNLLLDKDRLKKSFITIGIILAGYIIITNIESFKFINQYFNQRFNELVNNSGSGGIRYVGTFGLLLKSLTNRPIRGYGIGASSDIANLLGDTKTSLVGNTIVRVGIELGILGMILYFMFLIILIVTKLKKYKNSYYKIFLIFSLVQVLNSDMFLDPMYWALLYFINIDFKEDNIIKFNKKAKIINY